MGMATLSTMMTVTMGIGGCLLWRGALALLLGGLTLKEQRDRWHRRMAGIEWDGRIMIRTPTPNDSDDEHPFLGIKEGSFSITIFIKIIAVQYFSHPLLPDPPNTNISFSCSTQSPHTPQSHASSIIQMGEHDSAAHQSPLCPCCWALLPIPDPQSFCLITSLTAYPPPPGPHHFYFQYWRIQWCGPLSPGTMPTLLNKHGLPPCSSPSFHWHPIPSKHPKIICLHVEGCHAAIDNICNACCRWPHPPNPVYEHLFFYYWNINTVTLCILSLFTYMHGLLV